MEKGVILTAYGNDQYSDMKQVYGPYVMNVYCELYVINRFCISLKTEKMLSNCYLACICVFR